MNIAFCAGGTLGHINPALTFIDRIKDTYKNTKIILITTEKDKKYSIISSNKNIDKIYYIKSLGLPRNIFKIPKSVYINIKALEIIKRIYKEEKIDVVIGMGGYISGLGIYIANKLHLKTVVHEQNSVLGFANKINIKKTNLILTSFKNTKGLVNDEKVRWIGNPQYSIAKRKDKSAFANRKSILVTSGTLGSKCINDVVCELINSRALKNYTITFVTGKKYYDEIINKVITSKRVQVIPFTSNMLDEMSRAGIIISRAGSSTLFEILAIKNPAIIIPSPNVTNNHQYYNALEFKDQGLIKLIEEQDLNFNTLLNALITIDKEYDVYVNKLKDYKLKDTLDEFINELNKLLGVNNE